MALLFEHHMANRLLSIRRLLLAAIPVVFAASVVRAEDAALYKVSFTDSAKQQRTIEGKIVVEAQDGGIVLLGRDGTLWNITPENLKTKTKTDDKFDLYTAKELVPKLKAEFGDSFTVQSTRNYVLCSSAGRYYTQWCGALLERLMAGFLRHWSSKTLDLQRPKHPLIAVVFGNRKQFAEYATKDAGPAMASSVGYYSARTNRIVLLDLTGGPNAQPARSVAEVTRKVGASPFNVATVIHEATHQVAFNSGLHTRYADNPVWLTEGMAMYFESPDLQNPKGWRKVGQVNPFRLKPFRTFAAKDRPADSLQTLVVSDKRFTDAKTAADAYAEAWALTYFLIKTRRRDYERYLKAVADKPPLIWDKPQQRLKEFQTAFGDLQKLNREFLRFYANPRLR